LSIVCQAETAERRPIRTELRIADHEAGDWTSGDISGRDPFGDEAACRRSTFVAELAGHQELGLRAYSDVISERSGGRISEIRNRAGMVGTRRQLEAPANGVLSQGI